MLTLRLREGDQRPFFWMDVNGKEASLHWINSFLEETAYHLMNQQLNLLIFNMFYTKQYFVLDWTIFKKCCFTGEVTDFLQQVGFSLRHFSFIPMVGYL